MPPTQALATNRSAFRARFSDGQKFVRPFACCDSVVIDGAVRHCLLPLACFVKRATASRNNCCCHQLTFAANAGNFGGDRLMSSKQSMLGIAQLTRLRSGFDGCFVFIGASYPKAQNCQQKNTEKCVTRQGESVRCGGVGGKIMDNERQSGRVG